MARQKTDFTNFINAHPNYFPGQYLLEDDFEIQHQYLSERQRYHQQSLHVSGIIEGLEVEVITDKKEVQVKSGAAINSNGDLIVLKINTSFTDFKNLTSGTSGELYLRYQQEKQLKQQEDYTRWQEVASLEFAVTSPSDGVKLAKITITGDTVTLDASIRSYSGIFLPNAGGNDLTLCSGGNANPNLAILTGSLSVTGDLTVNNNFTANNGAITNVLAIGDKPSEGNAGGNRDWMTRGIKVSWGSDNLFIGLKDEGANRQDAVIAWGDDPDDNLRFIHAQSAASIPGNEVMKLTPSGNLSVTGTITGNIDAVNINSGTLSVDRIPTLPATKITGGLISGGTISGNLSITGAISFGSTTRQMINLYSTDYGIGVQGSTQYFRSGSNFAWYKGGSHNDTQFNAGTNGTSLMTLDGNGSLTLTGAIIPSIGNAETKGIMFPKDPAGGSGDSAWIRYYPRSGEACTLEIGISNDPNDFITLNPRSNPINFTGQWNGTPDVVNVTNVAEISNDTDGFKTLMIIGNKSNGQGRRVSVWDRFEVNGIFVNNSSQEHKKDITKLSSEDLTSIIEKLKQTPVFRYRFKTPGIDGKMRLGVIAEQSPEEILDESGKAVSFLDYNGFLLAALKAQQSLIEQLQNDILLLQKR